MIQTTVNLHSFFCLHHFQTLQEAIDAREENLLWLKSRLTGLSDVSSELEVQRQRTALGKLSTDLRALFSSLCQVFKDTPPPQKKKVFSTTV